MKNIIRPVLVLFIIMTVLTGVVYPFLVTKMAQFIYPKEAKGSLVTVGNKVVGSYLIGQNFSEEKYFWGRPSATSPMPYNASNSGGSNLGPTNPSLVDSVKKRIEILHKAHPNQKGEIPQDLVTTSASGLDPHISAKAAYYQVERVALARNLEVSTVKELVSKAIEKPDWGMFGEERVNVLKLNLALDQFVKGSKNF